jgi:2-keto-3-deoxy-L-rhamnonate aldolase RhmA
MRENPLRRKLLTGGTAYGIMAAEFFTPGFCAIAARAGAEYVIFDMEHGGVGIDTLKAQFAFARGSGLAPLVRVNGHAYHLIAPLLDAGAMGIMVPMLETAEQAAELAAWCRYRPEGRRGVGFTVAHDDYGMEAVPPRMAAANERTLAIALVETARGIENVEAIMATPGIDLGWMGHYDLTDSLGITAEFEHPRFRAALDRFLAACTAAGKPAGIIGTSVPMVRDWRAKGFRCLCYGTDVTVFQTALRDALAALRGDVAPPLSGGQRM